VNARSGNARPAAVMPASAIEAGRTPRAGAGRTLGL
jgi:hypothetical protein